MKITATNLRQDLFQVFERAKGGEEVLVLHKGAQFRIVPEKPVQKLSRIEPVDLTNPAWTQEDEARMQREMWAEIEADWNALV